MFNFNKEKNPPSIEVQNKVNFWLKELKEHLNSADTLVDTAWNSFEESQQKIIPNFVFDSYSKAQIEIDAAKSCAKNLRKTWSKEKMLWNELDLALEASEKIPYIGSEMCKATNRFTQTDDNKYLEEHKKLVHKNRFWDAEQRKHFARFSELLPDWIEL